VIDYDSNITDINPEAGRISLDIGENKSYLSALPTAYTLLHEGLVFYNQMRQNDLFEPQGELVPYDCPTGLVCANIPNWLKLHARDILGVEAYFGQQHDEIENIYLIKSLYQPTSTDLELDINSQEACQYQACINDNNCEDITLTEQRGQLLADVSFNSSQAILSFCQTANNTWSSCGIVQQTQKNWGRDEELFLGDTITPNILYMQNGQIEQRTGKMLVVNESAVLTLKTNCELTNATIFAAYYGLNGQRQIERLCVGNSCENTGISIKP